MDLYIGGVIVPMATVKQMLSGCRDGSDLVDKFVAKGAQLTHEDHIAILKWFWRVQQFA